MRLQRICRHLVLPHWWVLRALPEALLQRIERAVAASESTHRGELRVVVEANLPLSGLWRGQSARARAIELFSQLRVWDTEENCGVLIYLQLIDRRVEIVADRGINACVGQEFWEGVCRHMESAFRSGDFEGGTLLALRTITAALAEHFAATGEKSNELPNAPLVL
ncbi:TPM domain-containing protein [Candidatus Accumulibacter cognatus]|uniref:TPM domain-containing protein n=1 Tax=Candidatus Accumulibacter cognatus TaxID=2954383 RepID=A0A080M7K3_9PROT|nr:TPM domain-containing protein [Candidatus Accumulibacter cognatus]KFB77243.1 MAG: hypothetical protein AW06_001657 [Candidatus Accumulibacter cognatus]